MTLGKTAVNTRIVACAIPRVSGGSFSEEPSRNLSFFDGRAQNKWAGMQNTIVRVVKNGGNLVISGKH